MNLSDFDAVIFDMDGVILDTETICQKAWQITAKEMNIPEKKINEMQLKCLGTNKTDTFRILSEINGPDFDIHYFMKRNSELFYKIEADEGISVMKGAREILDFFKENKMSIALASSTRKPVVESQLSKLNLLEYFETFSTGDMVIHSKPNPEIYLMAVNSLGLKPENCFAIEDSPNGLMSAKTAGLTTVMVPDRIKPEGDFMKHVDYLYDSLLELLEDFRKIS